MSNNIPNDWDGQTFFKDNSCIVCGAYHGIVNGDCEMCMFRVFANQFPKWEIYLNRMGITTGRNFPA